MQVALKRMMVASVASVATLGLAGGSTFAATTSGSMYQTNLTALNGSGTSGTAMVEAVDDNTVKVTLNTTGASASLPHAQHIHVGGNNVCPAPSADKNGDDLVDTVEGQPSYGGIKIALTTTGDTSKDSGLAVDRFPTADANGNVTYTRTFDLPSGVTMTDIANGVVVQHGIASLFNDKTKYDGDKKSPLKDSLPLEATIPSACGKLTSAAAGGVDTGSGSTTGLERPEYMIAGVVALTAGAAFMHRRFANTDSQTT